MIHSTQRAMALRSVYRKFDPFTSAFHWYEAGEPDAPVVILAHGYMAHSMAFRRVVADLARDYRLIVPDLPGHGRDRSFRDSNVEPNIDSLVDWFASFIENVAPNAILIGHSLGATVAYKVVQQCSTTRAVVLVSPGLRLPSMRLAKTALALLPPRLARFGMSSFGMKLMEPMQWKGTPMDSYELAAYIQPLKAADRMEFILRLGMDLLDKADRTGDVHKLSMKSMLVWGSEDHVIPLQHGVAIHERLPGTEFVIIDGSGHSPMEDRPESFVEAFRDFMNHP